LSQSATSSTVSNGASRAGRVDVLKSLMLMRV
jgi:hypothetical protein